MGAITEQGTRELPALETAEGEPPAAERQAVERSLDERAMVEPPVGERSLDERAMVERPVGERRLAEPRGPARGQSRQTVPEPPQARDRETGRELPPAGPPAAPDKIPHEPALPTGTGGRPVQAQRAVHPVSGLPLEEPAAEKPAPAAEDTAPEQAAAGRADAGAVVAREAGAAAARIQRTVGMQGAREAEPDRRTLLRRALQPRIVPTVVQAAPADGAQGAGAAGQGAAAAAAPEEEGEPDVESLARDVYRILRRRLLVERERDLGAR